MGQVVLVTGVAGDLGRRFAAQLSKSPGVERVIGIDMVPPRGDLGARRLRARRHPQPRDRQGDRARARRHRRAHQRVRHPGRGRRPHLDEGAQRHRDDAAARRLPAGARRAQAGGQVERRGLRRLQPRPGHVHRGHERQAAGHAAASPRTSPRSSPTPAASPAAVPTSPSPRCGSPTSSVPTITSAMTGYFRLPVIPDRPRLQPPAAVRARAGRPRRARARHRHRGHRHLQHRRRRGHHPRPGRTPPRPAVAPAARLRRPRFGSAIRQTRVADFSPEQVAFLTFGRGLDTTRMRSMLGFEPSFTTAEAFADFAASVAPGIFGPRAGARHRVGPRRAPSTSGRGAVGDAEIIPIGTRGKPGRGTGDAKPSSNSRSLAAKTPSRTPARRSESAARPRAELPTTCACRPRRPGSPRRTSSPRAKRHLPAAATKARRARRGPRSGRVQDHGPPGRAP